MIPILDLTCGVDLDIENCKELVSHLSSVGFVYLKNHKISAEKIEASRKVAKEFFARSGDYKESFCENLLHKYVGYKPYESERLNPVQKEKDAREAILFDAHTIQSNHWPNSSFEETLTPLIQDLGQLAVRVLKMIGIGLGLENPNILADAHSAFHRVKNVDSRSFTSFRINYYPKLEKSQLKEDQVQCGEHADFGSITLLIQDHVRGLEVFPLYLQTLVAAQEDIWSWRS